MRNKIDRKIITFFFVLNIKYYEYREVSEFCSANGNARETELDRCDVSCAFSYPVPIGGKPSISTKEKNLRVCIYTSNYKFCILRRSGAINNF